MLPKACGRITFLARPGYLWRDDAALDLALHGLRCMA
jgi:hypothetical protein